VGLSADLDPAQLQPDFHVESCLSVVVADHVALDDVFVGALEEVRDLLGVACALLWRDEHDDVAVADLVLRLLEHGHNLVVGLLYGGLVVDYEGAGGLLLALGLNHAFPLLQFATFFYLVILHMSVLLF